MFFKLDTNCLTLPDLGGGGGGGGEPTPQMFSSITFDRDKISKRNFVQPNFD